MDEKSWTVMAWDTSSKVIVWRNCGGKKQVADLVHEILEGQGVAEISIRRGG